MAASILTKEEAITRLRAHAAELHAKYGLKRLGLFGSIARGEQKEGSDVDVVVEFEQPLGLEFVDFAEELESILGAEADVLTPLGLSSIRNRDIAKSIEESVEYVIAL